MSTLAIRNSLTALTTSAPLVLKNGNIRDYLHTLIVRIKDFISRLILEPWENFKEENRSFRAVASWLFKLNKGGKVPQFQTTIFSKEGRIKIDERFIASRYMEKLKTIAPVFKNPAKREYYIAKLNDTFKEGTCSGKARLFLKYEHLFDLGALNPKTLEKIDPAIKGQAKDFRECATFLHVTQFFLGKLENALALQRLLKKQGKSLDYLLQNNGELDRAKLFDLLRKENPGNLRLQTRITANFIDLEDLQKTEKELAGQIDTINHAVTEELAAQANLVKKRPHFFHMKLSAIGTQAETAQKISSFLLKNPGAFELVSHYKGCGIAHSMFLKTGKQGCLVFDPGHNTWYFYSSKENGIAKTLQFMEKFLPRITDTHIEHMLHEVASS